MILEKRFQIFEFHSFLAPKKERKKPAFKRFVQCLGFSTELFFSSTDSLGTLFTVWHLNKFRIRFAFKLRFVQQIK